MEGRAGGIDAYRDLLEGPLTGALFGVARTFAIIRVGERAGELRPGSVDPIYSCREEAEVHASSWGRSVSELRRTDCRAMYLGVEARDLLVRQPVSFAAPFPR